MENRILMKRFVDKYYGTYSVYTIMQSGIYVKCPRCNGLGIVTANNRLSHFKCTKCGNMMTKEYTNYQYEVHNQCEKCGIYYRVNITEKKQQHFHKLYVHCPSCGYGMSGVVQKKAESCYSLYPIQNACEPFFGLELWVLSSFCGKPVWALNREHLTYLIEYLSADLRQKPARLKVRKTQSHHLPTFMKTAKHRDKIVKLLNTMQNK